MASPRDPSHQGPGYSGVRYVEPPSGSRSATAERRRSSAGAGPSAPPTFTVTSLETNDYSSELSRPPNPFMPREPSPAYGGEPFIPEINPQNLVDRLQASPGGSRRSSCSAGSRRNSSSAGMGQQSHLMPLGTTSPSRDQLSVQHNAPGYDPRAYDTLHPVSPVSGASSPRGRTGARLSPQLDPLPSHEASAHRSRSRPDSLGRIRTPSGGHHTRRSARCDSERRNSINAVGPGSTTAYISEAQQGARSRHSSRSKSRGGRTVSTEGKDLRRRLGSKEPYVEELPRNSGRG